MANKGTSGGTVHSEIGRLKTQSKKCAPNNIVMLAIACLITGVEVALEAAAVMADAAAVVEDVVVIVDGVEAVVVAVAGCPLLRISQTRSDMW